MNDKDERNAAEGASIIGVHNPTSNENVDLIKRKSAELIDAMSFYCPAGRRRAIAITHIEEAAMMAVKSLFEG